MHRRGLALGLLAALPGIAALAQEAPRPQPPPRGTTRPAAPPTSGARPAAPSVAPPVGTRPGAPVGPPPVVATPPAVPPPPPPIAMPQGMQALANGGWRMRLSADAREVPAGFRATLVEIAQRLKTTSGRVTIIAQAPAPALEHSFARRLSLERALATKAVLVSAGLEATRIDLRPLGRQPNGADQVDILPPGAPR